MIEMDQAIQTLHVREDATKRMTIATTDSNKAFVSN